jgi:hypothetical protein
MALPWVSRPRRRSRSPSVLRTRPKRNFQAEVRGRGLMSGLPKTVLLSPEEVRDALAEPVGAMVDSVITCLGQAPPELAQDLITQGLYLVGGGSLLRGLDRRLALETEGPGSSGGPTAGDGGVGCRPGHRELRGATGHVHGCPQGRLSAVSPGRRLCAVSPATVWAGSPATLSGWRPIAGVKGGRA